MYKFCFPCLFTLILLFSVSESYGQTADFLIVEQPDELTIFNRYQQTLSESDSRRLKPFTPFRIIEENGQLSDGLTPVLKAEWNGQVFYLLKDDENNLSGIQDADYSKIFRRCRIMADTVQILSDNRLTLKQSGSSETLALQKGELLVRLFKSGKEFYVFRDQKKPAYGWLRSGGQKDWEVFKAAKSERLLVISDNLQQRIRTRIAAANRSYIDFFAHFNRISGNRSVIPEWQLSKNDRQITYELNDRSLAEKLEKSNEYLIRDLENILLGTGITLNYEPGMISIFIASGNK